MGAIGTDLLQGVSHRASTVRRCVSALAPLLLPAAKSADELSQRPYLLVLLQSHIRLDSFLNYSKRIQTIFSRLHQRRSHTDINLGRPSLFQRPQISWSK